MIPNWPKEKKIHKTDIMGKRILIETIDGQVWRNGYNKARKDCLPLAEKLQKERDGYREALEQIAKSEHPEFDENPCGQLDFVIDIAEKALKDEGKV